MKVLTPRAVVNLSIPYPLRERLHELSTEQGATLSRTVSKILTQHFEALDKRATPSRRKATAQKGGAR